MKEHGTEERPIHCFGCEHFYITHDHHFPYGCHTLGFKSLRNPALEVLESSGMECAYFSPKKKGAFPHAGKPARTERKTD